MATSDLSHSPATLQQKVKQLELALKKQQAKTRKKIKSLRNYYESMLAHMPGHVYWLDKQNRYLGCNDLQAKHAGLPSRKAIVGKTNYDLTCKEQAYDLNQANSQVMETGQPVTVEEFVELATGPAIWLSHKVPLRDDNHQIIGLLGISLDISEQKRNEKKLAEALEQAEAANQAKSLFIANMSHDIRTPLSGIIGMSALLMESVAKKEEKQYAHWIHESGQQLLTLLNHILELVSADNHSAPTQQTEWFSLKALLHDIMILQQPTLHTKGLTLQIKLDPHLPQYIYGNRFKLNRILLNLLGNAIKFTHKGDIEILVNCHNLTATQATLSFHIIDTGIGIPLTAQPHLFERFFRAHPADQGLYHGSGIGLHIVKTLVVALGGEIQVSSEENKGSTFTFQLTFKTQPTLSLSVRSSLHESSSITQLPASHPQHCLLIEDNLVALKLLEQYCSKLGHTFQSATSAEEALEQLQHQAFNLIITDIGLPGLSGIDFAHLIRQHYPHLETTKIIGLTAHAPQTIIDLCLQAGMATVLTKPITLQTLNHHLTTLCTKPSLSSTLGPDLPHTEQELFELDALPLLDTNRAIELLGDVSILKDMLSMMIQEQIPHDLPLLKEAYQSQNWSRIESLAHKMKAGALYCGTIRLQTACQYLERYRKAGHAHLLEPLYQQLLRIIDETTQAIQIEALNIER